MESEREIQRKSRKSCRRKNSMDIKEMQEKERSKHSSSSNNHKTTTTLTRTLPILFSGVAVKRSTHIHSIAVLPLNAALATSTQSRCCRQTQHLPLPLIRILPIRFSGVAVKRSTCHFHSIAVLPLNAALATFTQSRCCR